MPTKNDRETCVKPKVLTITSCFKTMDVIHWVRGGPDIFWNDGQTASFATSAYMFWHLGRAGVWQFCYGAVWIPSQISKGIPSQKQDPTIQV